MALKWMRILRERRQLKKRALFRYHDGSRERRADPAEIWRKLLGHPQMQFAEMMPLAEQGREPESSIVLTALGEIFAVHLWDEASQSGLTTWEILDLVRQFDDYLTALKKSTSPSQMPWQLSAYGSSTGPAPPAETMNCSAGSSSTPAESRTAADTPPCEPSPTPS